MKPSISATHCSMHLVFVRNDKYDISYIYISYITKIHNLQDDPHSSTLPSFTSAPAMFR